MKRKKHINQEYLPRITEYISRKFDLPIDEISNIPTVEIKNDSEVYVCGCIGIEKYESEIIILRMKKCPLTILGKGMYLHTFTDMRLSVYGRINAVIWGKNVKDSLMTVTDYTEDNEN